VIEGDITRIEVDAIVSNDDVDGQMWSQVSRAIKSAAGSDVERQSREDRPYKLGQAWWTKAGALKLKGIVHVAAVGRQGESSLATIRECLDNAIRLAKEEKCSSLGVAAIGSGPASAGPRDWFQQFTNIALSHLGRRTSPLPRPLDIVLVLYESPDFAETVKLLQRAIWDSWTGLGDERLGEPAAFFESRWRRLTRRDRKPALDLDEEVVDFFYRWDRLERDTSELVVIDFDLLGESKSRKAAFSDRGEALGRASELLARADPQTLIGQKTRAAQTLLLALNGTEIPLRDFIARTLGVIPAEIPQETIESQHDRVTGLLQDTGYPHTEDGVRRMQSDTAVREEQIRKEFSAAVRSLLPQVRAAIGADFLAPYETKFVARDAYWSNWTDTDPHTGAMRLQINTHESIAWWQGKAEMLALHEIGGHICQAATWRERIERGELPRAAGVTTVFGPEAFSLEGLAQSLSWLLPQNPLSAAAERAQEMSHLGVLVWSNVHLMLHAAVPLEDALGYARRWAPGFREEQPAAKRAQEILGDLVLRTYLYAYGASAQLYRTLAEKLDADGRAELLRDAYSRPLLSTDLSGRLGVAQPPG
jgi:O-acetyl-ADP-ribose deacetylase (regulator of RNase III)